MKITVPTTITTKNKNVLDPPPIPLERPEKVKLEKDAYITLKLRTVPAEADSQTYDLALVYFNTGTPEQWFKFRRDLNKCLVGQNVTTGPGKYSMARRVLEGDALARFNEAATEHGNETNANFEICLNDVTTHVFPQRALQKQRRYMRRHMRKPQNLSIRSYVTRASEINDYLAGFPPFAQGQSMPEDELLELLEFGIPRSWQNQFTLQGFDPQDPTNHIADFVRFCERLEATETSSNSQQSTIPKKKPSNPKTSDNKRKLQYFEGDVPTCMLHGPGHSTENCKVLQAQAKKIKSKYQSQSGNNKTHNDRGTYSRKELNAIVASAIAQATTTEKAKKTSKSENHQVDLEGEVFSSDNDSTNQSSTDN